MSARTDEEPTASARPHRLPDAYRLLRVLEAVERACGRKGAWRFHVLLFTVHLDRPRVIGTGTHVWLGDAGGAGLHGFSPRDFLAAHREVAPAIDPAGPIVRYEELASGSLADRLHPVARTVDRRRVLAALDVALAERARLDDELAAARAADPAAPPWTTCPVCCGADAYSYAAWKAGELTDGGVPVADGYLEILGAPHFGDSVGSRDWCIKRCFLCATHYHWKGDYEYLAGGTEDSITITRLAPADLPGWLEVVDARVRAATGGAP